MRRTKQPRAIYSSLDDIAAEVLRIAQVPPANPGLGGETAGELVQKTQEPAPVPSVPGNGGESGGTNGESVSSVAEELPGTSAKIEAAAAESEKRLLGRRVAAKDPCPGCNQDILWRIHRQGWMRLLPGSRHFVCEACEARYLAFCGRTVRLA